MYKKFYIFRKSHPLRAFAIISLVFTFLALLTAYNSWYMYQMLVPLVFSTPLLLLFITVGFNEGEHKSVKWFIFTITRNSK